MRLHAAAGLLGSLALATPVKRQAPTQYATGNGSVPAGFVTTNGNHFELDGEPFYFAGSNAYYIPFFTVDSDYTANLQAAKDAGLKVMRTWGFNDANETTIAGGLPQYGSNTPVFQTFYPNGSVSIDLTPYDKVIAAAETTGMKLIITFTNNWADYGGMDVYNVNLGGKHHDDFYVLPAIRDAYKNYVSTFINRYKSSSAVMAWELANEPRCGADGVRNLPRSTNCTSETLTTWMDEMSTFIKSVDANHLVTTGSEGAYANASSTDGFYNGADGNDFVAQIALPNIDFNTFHSYPDWWSKTVEWTNQWIRDHAASGRAINKPVLHEEYGWLSPAARLSDFGTVSNETRTDVLSQWQQISVEEKLSDCYWQFGFSNHSFGRNYDDGFTIYLDDPEAQVLVYEHAEAMNALTADD